MTEVAPESTPARLALVTGRLNRRLTAATGGLSHGLLSALATVAKHGPLRLAELAQFELVAAPGVTRIVAELESRGLVTRSVDPDDGRAQRIEVTPAGTEAVQRARAARACAIAELLEGLDETDLRAIEAALPALERMLGPL
ncbi:MAG: MarR family transcriptional regulator [Galbitalea sp.]